MDRLYVKEDRREFSVLVQELLADWLSVPKQPVIAVQTLPTSLTLVQSEVISALTNLGSTPKAAESRVPAVSGGGDMDLDTLLRSALQAVAA
jgi:Holliday junction resolvasome RuvABC DNA-binding subunit